MVATLVLCAGLGTRLAPLSSWRAKPLVPIGDGPAVASIVAQVRALGGAIVLNAHHRADQIAAYARSAGLLVSREEDLLGTAGGLRAAGGLLGAGDVLVWNGDMIGELDPRALLTAHAAAEAVATLVVRPRSDSSGNTGLDPEGNVVRLRRETCRAGEVRTADFLGIYVVGDAIRRDLPATGDIIAEAFLPAMRKEGTGGRIAAFATDAPFLDVGTPRAYLDANLRWLARRGATSWIGEGAQVDPRATLDGVVLGDGARVEGEGKVEGCVAWPGAVLRAPMARSVVAIEGVVLAD